MVPQVPVPEAQAAGQTFDPGAMILGHVSNSSLTDPLIHLPTIFGIDLSVTKHVFVLWMVAATVFVVITALVQRFVRQARLVPGGPMNVLEVGVEFIQDTVIAPNIGRKWTNTWTPLILTFFLFILASNMVGLVPIFDVLEL